MENPVLKILVYAFMPSGLLFKFLQRFYVTMIIKSLLLLLFIMKECKKGKQAPSYLGKFANVGT